VLALAISQLRSRPALARYAVLGFLIEFADPSFPFPPLPPRSYCRRLRYFGHLAPGVFEVVVPRLPFRTMSSFSRYFLTYFFSR